MINLYKMSFFVTLIVGTLITIASNSWLGMWMGLEINLLSIIPLMNNSTNPRSSEAALKYFITQTMASMVLLMAMLMMQTSTWNFSDLNLKEMPSIVAIFSLAMKMGAAPFHFWLPEVMEGLTWMNSLILLTWQKIAPMCIMFLIYKPIKIMAILILFCMLVSGIMGMNQTSLQKIMAYSSINHMGWMLAALTLNQTIWTSYFLIYSLMNVVIVAYFSWNNSFQVNHLFKMFQQNPKEKIIFSMNFMSLAGIPPFIGFLPKWMVIQALTLNHMMGIAYLMIVFTLITMYYYLRISIPPLTFSANSNIQLTKIDSNMSKTWFLANLFLLSSLLILTFSFNWM
nr:NADH dehydrogenase subunit 2 [Habroloma sp.]